MLGNLDEELRRAMERLQERDRVRRLQESAAGQLEQVRAKLEGHKRHLARERKDVERLEGLSLEALFQTVLGRKETCLEKERQEHLAAKLKLDAALDAAAGLERDLEEHRAALEKLQDADQECERLLARKEALLASAGDERSGKLAELASRSAELSGQAREIREAIDAGTQVQGALHRMEGFLREAEGWGNWDMLGGGVLTTMAKHGKMDEAREEAKRLQRPLLRFQRELEEINVSTAANVELGSFDRFADYFFDGLIADWVVQSRIQTTLGRVREARSAVRQVLSDLERRLKETEQAIREAQEERRRLLEPGA